MLQKNPRFILSSTVKFDRTSSIANIYQIQMDFSKPFSLCFWIKTSFTNVTPIIAQMELKKPSIGWDVIINKENSEPGALRFQVIRSFPNDFLEVLTNANHILDDDWHHVVITYDGSKNARKIIFVIDGKKSPLIVISDCLTEHPTDQIPLTIGSRLNQIPEFEGSVYDVRIYDSQLNMSEIKEIYGSSYFKRKLKEKSDIIKLSNITKIYRVYHNSPSTIKERIAKLFLQNHVDRRVVLDGIDLTIKSGELVGVIGKNGSGKSTLLKILAGVIEPTSGSVSIHGTIAPFLSLGSGFNSELDARENIILYGLLLGHTKKSIMSKIDEILHFAELEAYSDIKLKTFSSGMLMRLAFSIAVSLDPDILLIDEVLAVGDESFQQKSFNKLISFRNLGKTIVFVTHNLTQVESLCDRAIFINDGKIHSMGDPHEIVENYKNLIY